MAYADYIHCAECDCKAIYDGDWDYAKLHKVLVVPACAACEGTGEYLIDSAFPEHRPCRDCNGKGY